MFDAAWLFLSLSSSVPLLLTKAKAGIMDIRETK